MNRRTQPCQERWTRRDLLRAGCLGFGGLTLADIFRLRAAAKTQDQSVRDTAVIFISLGGGASHFETYDPKPDAPSEYRGSFQAIRTSVPGVHFCELLPQQAPLMDKLSIVRSVQHEQASHIALHIIETGYDLRSSQNAIKGEMPSVGAVVARTRGTNPSGIPSFVSIPKPHAYSNPHWLGAEHNYFPINDDPNASDFKISNLALLPTMSAERLSDRQVLRRDLGRSRQIHDLDHSAAALDSFTQQALDLITGEKAQRAFAIEREDPRLRDRYGRTPFGQRLVLARRLVEAEVPFVHVRTFDWDDHDKLAERMTKRCPEYDTALSALIEDLHQRGMNENVLVVAMGEFGRTPRVNPNAGRDHWPKVMSVLLAGGRYRHGQVIGASDPKGATVTEAPYRPENILSMVYRHLGIDPATTFNDYSGRPRHVLEEREPVAELL